MRFYFLLSSLLLLGRSEPENKFLIARPGQDYALFFAVNKYQFMDNLRNPIQNAHSIAMELHDQYGFQTEVVENPTIDDIDSKLAEYQRKFTSGEYKQEGQLRYNARDLAVVPGIRAER